MVCSNKMNLKTLLTWIKRDFIIYLVCFVAVLVCLLTYNNSLTLISECNKFHVAQFEAAGCGQQYKAYNISGLNINEAMLYDIKNNS